MGVNKNFTRRRWLVLVLYGIINLCVGALYAWSVFAGLIGPNVASAAYLNSGSYNTAFVTAAVLCVLGLILAVICSKMKQEKR